MIEFLGVATPRHIVDRSHVDPAELKKFERVTGIKKTRRYSGTMAEFLKESLDECPFDFTCVKIDALIVVTQTPDRLSPCMAAEIHHHLKLPPWVPAIDMNHACDGFIMGLWAGHRLGVRSLVICADQLRYEKTQTEGLIFSDAISVCITNSGGVQDHHGFHFYTDGSKHEKLYCGLDGRMDMDGNAVFDFVTMKMPKFIEKHGVGCDFLVPHQANMSMNRILETRAGYRDRTLYSIEEYGNQSMNSIPTAICMNEEKILGKKICMCGFGAGYTAALVTWDWPREPVTTMWEV